MGLQLLHGDSLARDLAKARVPSLAAQPFRPGELAMPIRIELSARGAVRVYDEARRAGLPLELWARLGIEAARQVERAVDLAALTRTALIAELDKLAIPVPRAATSTLARDLHGYAHLLRVAAPIRFDGPPRGELTLLLPDCVAAGWTGAASAAGLTLSAWVGEMSLAAPTGAARWEAAAAEAGDSLGEWILAAALRGA